MKKLLSMLLCAVMLMSALQIITVGAETEGTYGNLKYKVYDTYVEIIGYIGEPKEIIIPSEIDGLPVTSIGECAFAECENLTSVTIDNGVTSIGANAFSGCSSLTSITIPDSVTNIGNQAFEHCKNLTSVTIGNSVTSIGQFTFSQCENLTSVTIGGSVKSIETYAFSNCSSLTNITIPDSVISIGYGAFFRCNSLTSVTIGNNVTSIGEGAFHDCRSLTNIIIPNSVTSIGEGAFYNCNGLTSATIGNGIISVGNYAFYNCRSLESIYISDVAAWCDIDFFNRYSNPLYYAKNLYINGELTTNIAIPDNVISIGDFAFSNCSNLISITIPDSVTNIGSFAFELCNNLASVNIPNSVTIIGESAFYCCENLTSVIIGNGVTSIGDIAFYGCENLTNIIIGNSVTSIGNGAFYACWSLTDVYYSGSEEKWNNISIGEDNEDLFSATIHFSETSGTCGNNLTWSLDNNGTLTISGTGDMWNWEFNGRFVTSPFYQNNNIKRVVIKDEVTSIGDWAFSTCENLTNVIIPDSVTSIGKSAFWNCSSLTSIDVSPKNQYYCSENEILFNKDKTELIQYPAKRDDTSYIIPDSVISIGENAFESCKNLISITIPNKVTSIEHGAFARCDSLSNVYYCGTESQWNSINIGEVNDCLINAAIHYNYVLSKIEGVPTVREKNGVYTISAELQDINDNCAMVTVLTNGGKTAGVNTANLIAGQTDANVTVTADNADTVKIFIWESLDSMKPLCAPKTITIK